MHGVWHAVELKHDDLSILRPGDHFLEVIEGPIRIRVARRRDEQRVILFDIEQGPDLDLAVRNLRLHSTPRELDAMQLQLFQGFGPEVVAGPCEADGLWHAD